MQFKMLPTIFAIVFAISAISAQNEFQMEVVDIEEFSYEERFDVEPDRFQDAASIQLTAFSYSDCGSASAPLHVKTLKLSPDPLRLPGTLTVTAHWQNTEQLTAPIQAKLEMKQKWFGFWKKIPCKNNVGSCTYKDVCAMSPYKNKPCPSSFGNKPCKCPIKPNSYKLDNASYRVDKKLPWIAKGDFKIRAELTQAGKQIGCIELTLTLK